MNTNEPRPMRYATLVAAVILLPAAAPLPKVPLYRQFGRWLVARDNTRSCVIKGFDEVTRAELDLARAGGDAVPKLTLAVLRERPADKHPRPASCAFISDLGRAEHVEPATQKFAEASYPVRCTEAFGIGQKLT